MMVPLGLKEAMDIFLSGTIILIVENVIVYILKGPKWNYCSLGYNINIVLVNDYRWT